MAKTPQKAVRESVTDQQEVADKNQENGPKFAENRKKLSEKLAYHSKFVRAAGWGIFAIGLFLTGQFLWSFKGNFLLDIPLQLVFGTATSPGIPVAMVQALLTAFNPALAPLAPYLLVGGIAGLWLYQLSYHFLNEKLFAGNTNQKAKQEQSPEPENKAEEKAEPKKGIQLTQKSQKALANKESSKEKAAAKPKATKKAARKPSDDKKPAAKQGSGKAIVSAYNNQRLTRSMAKAQQMPKAAPAKRKTAKK